MPTIICNSVPGTLRVRDDVPGTFTAEKGMTSMLRATTNGLAMNVVEFDSLSRLTHDAAGDVPSSHP
jgi:hypothetical protein